MPKKSAKKLTFQQHRRAAEDQALAMLEAETPEEAGQFDPTCRQFHTGPKTPMGKATSSQNARKHGLCSITLLLPDENPQQHQTLAEGLFDEYKPATMTEKILVQEMIDQQWGRTRVRNREDEALHSGADFDDPMIRLCQRYRTGHSRAFDHALKTLRQIQRERRASEPEFVSQKSPQPPATEFVPQNPPQATAAAPAAPPASVEFVSQNAAPVDTTEFVSQNAAATEFVSQNAAATEFVSQNAAPIEFVSQKPEIATPAISNPT